MVAGFHLLYMYMSVYGAAEPTQGPEGETIWIIDPDRFASFVSFGWPFTAALAVLLALAPVAWFRWQDRAYDSVVGQGGVMEIPRRPGVWWWLVPVANLWVPFRIHREASIQAEHLADRGQATLPVTVWWVLWVIGGIALVAQVVLSLTLPDDMDQGQARALARSITATDALLIPAAAMAIVVVGRITSSLEFARRHPERLLPWRSPGA
ncbi:MAG TPA: DUF4328 domain-containing protein [Actinomycetota bacterium]|nr:DUF4328 domain-containing protein [Actinomycetota bacterium]